MISLRKHLFDLESSLLNPTTRRDSEILTRVIADDFLEFGASGRAYNKKAVVDSLSTEPKRRFKVSVFHMRELAPGCALVTYRLREKKLTSLRSSIWILRDGNWEITFHQGTVVG